MAWPGNALLFHNLVLHELQSASISLRARLGRAFIDFLPSAGIAGGVRVVLAI